MQQAVKDNVEIGLVLQGGGALGAYEFGAVTALLELMDDIDAIGPRRASGRASPAYSIGADQRGLCRSAPRIVPMRASACQSLWSELSLEASKLSGGTSLGRDLALFGVHGILPAAPRCTGISSAGPVSTIPVPMLGHPDAITLISLP